MSFLNFRSNSKARIEHIVDQIFTTMLHLENMINSVETDVNRLSYSDFNELVRLRNILLLQEKEFSDEVERNQNLLSETITVQGQQVICGNLILHFMNVVMDVDAIIAKRSK